MVGELSSYKSFAKCFDRKAWSSDSAATATTTARDREKGRRERAARRRRRRICLYVATKASASSATAWGARTKNPTFQVFLQPSTNGHTERKTGLLCCQLFLSSIRSFIRSFLLNSTPLEFAWPFPLLDPRAIERAASRWKICLLYPTVMVSDLEPEKREQRNTTKSTVDISFQLPSCSIYI